MKKTLIFLAAVMLLASCAKQPIYEVRKGEHSKLKRWERPQCIDNW